MATFDSTAIASVRKALARVTVHWGGTTDSIECTSPSGSNYIHSVNTTLIDQVADETETIPHKWFQCDGVTSLSENMYAAPGTAAQAESNQFGWWGNLVSDAVTGDFGTSQVLQVRTPARPVSTLRVVGDSAYGEYPVDFTVEVWSGLTLQHTSTVTGNAAVVWTATGVTDGSGDAIADATRTVLTITKWSEPLAVAKIAEFYSSVSVTYDGDEIQSMSILEENELKDATIPTGNISANELELSLNNIDDKFFPSNTSATLHNAVRVGRKIEVELGFLVDGVAEYESMGTYWSGDWKTEETGTVASTTARDRMDRLRKSDFYQDEVSADTTLYDLAVLVLEHAKISMPDLEYSVDAALDTSEYTIPVAFFDRVSHFDALKTIAGACLGRVYADRSGVVQVKGTETPGTYEYEITADNYRQRTQPANTEDVANKIEVTTQPLVATTYAIGGDPFYTSGEIYEITVAGEEETYKIKYDKTPVEDATIDAVAEAGSLFVGTVSATEYSWGADVTVTCTTPGTFKIKAWGDVYEVQGAETITATDSDSVFEYGANTFELKKNALVQTRTLAQTIANSLLESYKSPYKDVELDWRGNPKIQLDTIIQAPEYVKDAVSNKADFSTYKQKFTFDGSLSASLSGRRIRVAESDILQDTDGATQVMQDTGSAALVIQI